MAWKRSRVRIPSGPPKHSNTYTPLSAENIVAGVQLESKTGRHSSRKQEEAIAALLWVACQAGWGLALDQDRCLQILGECGFLPTGRFGVVNFCQIPDGLNAEELERFLRENGAETLGLQAKTQD